MPKALDLTGKRYGILTVDHKMPSHNGHTYWWCKCDCGNEKEVQTSNLTCGLTKSCGCQQSPGNTNVNKNFIPQEQKCPICQKTFINRQVNRHYCYDCVPEGITPDQRQIAKQRAFKHFLVNYKGGKCEICGYDKCEGALEFHHHNPAEKDIEISKWNFNYNSDINVFLQEVDKCMLLCANCHREQHCLVQNAK